MSNTCIGCGRPVSGRIKKCRDCVAQYRRQENYRTKTLARDGYVCAACPGWRNAAADRFYRWRRHRHPKLLQFVLWLLRIGRVRYVEVDHIIRLADGGSHDDSNLQVLCRRHHHRKTRTEAGGRRRRSRFRPPPRVVAAGFVTLAAGLAGAASPPQIPTVDAAGLAVAAIACLYLAVRAWRRRIVLDRLWNAELVGLPKQTIRRNSTGWSPGRSITRQAVPKGWGRGLQARRWRLRTVPGSRLIDRLPRYQPEKIIVRHRGWPLDDNQRRDAETKVSNMLGRPYRGSWDPARDRGTLEPIPPLPDIVYPFPADGDDIQLRIGQGETGPAVWNVHPATGQAHCLVVGGTGSGKSGTLRAIADAALTAGWSVSVADPKMIEMRALKPRVVGPPSLGNYATDLHTITELIAGVRSIMQSRYSDILDKGADPHTYQPILLVVDEVAELVDVARAEWKNPPADDEGKPQRPRPGEPPVIADLSSLARLGRSARVHLAVGIQRPDARFLEGNARDQYGCRIACGSMSAAGSRMIFGDGWSARAVEDHPGRVLMQTGHGTPTRLQVAWVPGEPAPAPPPVTAADA